MHKLHLPKLHRSAAVGFAGTLSRMIQDDPRQQRGELIPDERLIEAAMHKAEQLSVLGELAHIIDGTSPNANVRNHRYPLPDWYARDGNNVESIAVGQASPDDALGAFAKSDGHRKHVFGLTDFYRAQTRIGVGYTAQPSDEGWGHWWVVLTAHEAEGGNLGAG